MGDKRDYFDKLFEFSKHWCSKQMKPFSSDDLKIDFLANNDPPDNPKVFGNVMMALKTCELIFAHGYIKSKFKCAHGRVIQLWISKQYKEKQADNRRLNSKTQQKLF